MTHRTFSRRLAVIAVAAATAGGTTIVVGGNSNFAAAKTARTTATTKPSQAQIDSARRELLRLTRANADVQRNLRTFDTLDFDVFSNQKWDRLKESHAQNVRVVWPDGHVTVGIKRHIADLKQLFVYAPDTRIEEHPIKFGFGNKTAVTGVFQGTFTRPMPDGKGGYIQPTGKAFKFQMATISIWKRGLIVEEHLFWDNQTFLKQVGLAK